MSAATSMLAVRVHHYGGPDTLTLEEFPIPEPSANEILVSVSAAGVGPWDALIRTGSSGVAQTLPLTPGSDIAGIAVQTGSASGVRDGDEVFGVTNPAFTGGYAEYAVAGAGMIARKPRSLSFIEAASVPVVAVTAWQMLFEYADLKPGQTVLVHGAAGNVGAYAVQLANWAGANVIGVAAAGDEAYVRSLGAAETIDFRTQPFEKVVAGADVVVDAVGGEVQHHSFGVLKRGGIIVSSVSPPSQEDGEKYGVRVAYFIVSVTTGRLNPIAELIEAGKLKTHVGTVLGLRDARTAHEMLAGKVPHPGGKIVLDIAKTRAPD
ncbi:MAG: NADP-dependent oxidoreductase [Candidatus Cybelea sp.]